MFFSAPLLPLSYHQLRGRQGLSGGNSDEKPHSPCNPTYQGAPGCKSTDNPWCTTIAKKKAGVAECWKTFRHAGLPFNGPPSRAGLPFG